MKVNNKIAIITGGASGLGFSIAKEFARHEIRTIIIGRNEEKLLRAKEELGGCCTFYRFDLSGFAQIPSLIHEIKERYGQIDILVNNAGIHLKKPMIEVTDGEFQQVIATNLVSVFSMSREVSKVMLEQQAGNILNISSMAAWYGIPQVIAYTAAKSAIEGMTRAMAVELSPHGIRVNCIAPGFIKTNMSSSALDHDLERKAKVLSRTPMQELGRPEDVAAAAYFLTSDQARFITGTVLPVDGGNAIGF